MGYANGIVSKPVSAFDVRQALPSASNDIGTLCKHANINMWAKYKPTKFKGMIATGKESGSDYWKGDDRATSPYLIAGLNAPYASSLGSFTENAQTHKVVANSGFLYDLIRGNKQWSYSPPTGGIGANDYPYRLLDFDGYYKDASNPLPIAPEGSFGFGASYLRTLILSIPTIAENRNIQLTDMQIPSAISVLEPYVSSFYAGLVMWKEDFSDMMWKTATAPLDDLSVEEYRKKVSIATRNPQTLESRAGQWKCLVFLSSISGLDSDNASTRGLTGIFLPADTTPKNVILLDVTGDVNITITTAKWVSSQGTPRQVNVGFTVSNNTPDTVSVSDIVTSLVNSLEIEVASYAFSPVTLSSGASKTFQHLFTIPYEDLTAIVSINDGMRTITEQEIVTL